MNTSVAYVANDRTISLEPVVDYFEKIEAILDEYVRLDNEEKAKNESLPSDQRVWSHKYMIITQSYHVGRTDGGDVEYKSMRDLKNALLFQASSINHIYTYLSVHYNNIRPIDIQMTIRENKFKIEYNVDDCEETIRQLTEDLVKKIDEMPRKLDRIINQKSLIIAKVGFGMGMIPAIALGVASIFIPPMFELYRNYFFIFPLLILALGFIFGMFMGGAKLGSSYSKLIPTKYGGYDTRTHSSYRVDDMDAFTGEVDVLIGKKAGLASARQYIERSERLLKKFLLPELGITAVLTLIVFLITLINR